ncbi:hypothetical protein P280DRAFT_59978 [Massarina eburnea CBS 473.64]|uniref:Uncharacterized protein n=1 Tax=Massarina eburnea CBS 473.64 TaxID=1395130 RepID=A0A6A6RUX9_9PLEO|nr:hypothetical protein P280DRAFT_59978 [Massarina eburnea CBS 473.64]
MFRSGSAGARSCLQLLQRGRAAARQTERAGTPLPRERDVDGEGGITFLQLSVIECNRAQSSVVERGCSVVGMCQERGERMGSVMRKRKQTAGTCCWENKELPKRRG